MNDPGFRASVGLTGAVLAALAILFATPVKAASRYDPRLRFLTISTEHFTIHFHQGEERLARRLARIAEEVATTIAGELGRPRSRVHIVLVGQSDVSNGWAIPTPYNLIQLDTPTPRPGSLIGNTDDWLRLVFTHEYTHIVHLEQSRGWVSGLRRVFGAHPVLFPNVFLPLWQIEGLATFNESAVTRQGRVPASDFRLLLDRSAADARLEPLDRASGGLVDWPSAATPYLYGAYFHKYLADKYGQQSLARLGRATSGRVPYFGSGAFRTVFGRSLADLWREFQSSVAPNPEVRGPSVTQLTRVGFSVRAPRFARDGRLFYVASNPHGFPSIYEVAGADSSNRMADAYGTTQLSSTGMGLVYDQLEMVANVDLQADVYMVSANETRRLTHGSRAAEPDISADGQRIVCVVQRPSGRGLALLNVADGTAPSMLVEQPDTDYSGPRWSPDGSSIVAERRRVAGPSEIVLVDDAWKRPLSSEHAIGAKHPALMAVTRHDRVRVGPERYGV